MKAAIISLGITLFFGCSTLGPSLETNIDGSLWIEPSNKKVVFLEAYYICQRANAKGYNDWRLPTEYEMIFSLMNNTSAQQLKHNNYWTGTPIVRNLGYMDGKIKSIVYENRNWKVSSVNKSKSDKHYVRCTRGPIRKFKGRGKLITPKQVKYLREQDEAASRTWQRLRKQWKEKLDSSRSTPSSSQGGYCSADKECYRIISQSSDRVYIRCQSYSTSQEIVWIDRKSGEYVSSLISPIAEHSYSFKKIANWQCGVY